MENLFQTGFERRVLQKMANRHSCYKEKSWSRQLFQRTGIVREGVYLRTIDRKLTMNLIVIFNSFTDIFFLKYSSEIFLISYCFQEKILECFKAYVSVSNPILLKLGSSNVSPKNIFLEICRSFGITSKELVLENYALEYQTADKGHIDIL